MIKGIVYGIYDESHNLLYVGSTKSSLSQRMAKHRYDERHGSTTEFHEYIRKREQAWDGIEIYPLEFGLYNDEKELRQSEGYYQVEMKPPFNSRIEGKTEEQIKQYNREAHRQRYATDAEHREKKRQDALNRYYAKRQAMIEAGKPIKTKIGRPRKYD